MAKDDDYIRPEEAQMAIARAAQRKPQLQAAREKLDRIVGSPDNDEAMRMLANAIRRMLRQE